jgi:hypothetical protein
MTYLFAYNILIKTLVKYDMTHPIKLGIYYIYANMVCRMEFYESLYQYTKRIDSKVYSHFPAFYSSKSQ